MTHWQGIDAAGPGIAWLVWVRHGRVGLGWAWRGRQGIEGPRRRREPTRGVDNLRRQADMTDTTRHIPPLPGDDDVPAWAETSAGYGGRIPRLRTNEQAARLREAADLLDSIPGLPNLYIVCSAADNRVTFQVPSQSLDVATRITAVDRIAAAIGETCEKHTGDRLGWGYGTTNMKAPYEVYTAGLSADPTAGDRAKEGQQP